MHINIVGNLSPSQKDRMRKRVHQRDQGLFKTLEGDDGYKEAVK